MEGRRVIVDEMAPNLALATAFLSTHAPFADFYNTAWAQQSGPHEECLMRKDVIVFGRYSFLIVYVRRRSTWDQNGIRGSKFSLI